MSMSRYELFFHDEADPEEAARVVEESAPVLLDAVDAQRAMGRAGQAYRLMDGWVVAVGDRATGESQGLVMRADYYAIAYPKGSELAAYVIRSLAAEDSTISMPWVDPGKD